MKPLSNLRRVALAVAVVLMVAQVAAPALAPALAQQARDGFDESDWPCPHSYRAAFDAGTLWTGPDIAGLDWQGDPVVKRLTLRIGSPETSPAQGEREIDRFAAGLDEGGLDDAERETLTLLFAGLFEEIGGYRKFAVDGIWGFTANHRLLARVLAETEAAYLAVPFDGSAASDTERKRIEELRFWQLRVFDDAEDEARYLCHRLVYLEGKLGRLARAIARHMDP